MRFTYKALSLLLLLLFFIQSTRAQLLKPQADAKTGKFGYKNTTTGKWHILPQFQQAEPFNYNRAIVTLNDKTGLIDKNGKWIASPQYTELQGDSVYVFKKGSDTTGLLDIDGKILFQGLYDHIQYKSGTGSAILLKNDLYGYWDFNGTYISPISKYEIHFENGLSYFNSGDSIGYINSKGEIVFKTNEGKVYLLGKNGILHSLHNKEFFYTKDGKFIGDFQQVMQAGETWFLYKKNDLYGLSTYDGTVIGEFEEIFPFNDKGIAVAKKQNKYGVIDTLNHVLIPFEYQSIQPFGYKFNRYTGVYGINVDNSLYKANNLYGLLNNKGEVELAANYTNAYLENEILIKEENNIVSITDLSTKKEIPLQEIFVFNQGKAIYFFEKNGEGKYGLINKSGQIVLPASYKSLKSLWNGLFIAETTTGVGIIDTSATLIVPAVFKELLILNDLVQNRNPKNILFDNYVYAITKGDKAGVYSREGKKVVDTIWSNISVYDDDGKNFFGQDSKALWQIIFKDGRVIKSSLDEPVRFENRKAIARKKGKYGIITTEGKVIVPFKYNQLLVQDNGMMLCKSGDKWGIITQEGKLVIKPAFRFILPEANNVNLAIKNHWGVIKNGAFEEGFKELKPKRNELDSESSLKKTSFSFISLKEVDEFTLELFASETALSDFNTKANEYILNKVAPILISETSLNKPATVKDGKHKEKFSLEFIGKGVEILNSTDSTISLNFYSDVSGSGFNKVLDQYEVLALQNDQLKQVKLQDLFSTQDYETFLNEVIASRLREADYRIIPSSKGNLKFYDENYFQIDKEGLVLKVNEKVLDLTFDLVGPEVIVSYKELESIAKKDGPLHEFYK